MKYIKKIDLVEVQKIIDYYWPTIEKTAFELNYSKYDKPKILINKRFKSIGKAWYVYPDNEIKYSFYQFKDYIEQLILHELCHVFIHDHSKSFKLFCEKVKRNLDLKFDFYEAEYKSPKNAIEEEKYFYYIYLCKNCNRLLYFTTKKHNEMKKDNNSWVCNTCFNKLKFISKPKYKFSGGLF